MIEKKCKKCFIMKDLSLFPTRKTGSLDGYRNECKECTSIRYKKYRLIPDNLIKEKFRNFNRWNKKIHYVYFLPKENYIGTTKNILTRMSHHRSSGKDTTNYRILYSSEIRKDSLELERLLHDIGYKGRHKNNMYK